MKNTATSIQELLTQNRPAANTITNSLKTIGNGDMKKGVNTIYQYALHVGTQRGFIKGSVFTAGIGALIYCVHKGVPCVKSAVATSREHKKAGDQILEALKAEQQECEEESVRENEMDSD